MASSEYSFLQDPIIEKRLTSVSSSARVHVIEMGKCRNRGYLKEYLDKFSNVLYDKVLSIVPTGWTHEKGSTSSSSLEHLKIRKSGPGMYLCSLIMSQWFYLFKSSSDTKKNEYKKHNIWLHSTILEYRLKCSSCFHHKHLYDQVKNIIIIFFVF